MKQPAKALLGLLLVVEGLAVGAPGRVEAQAADVPAASIADTYVVEGNSGTRTVDLTVSLSAPSATSAKVSYDTVAGTASAGGDFVVSSGKVTIKAGKTTGTITVTVNGDVAVEGEEHFSVVLSAPVDATIADGTADVRLVDDDFLRDCTDGNPYTTDSYDGGLGYCTHPLVAGADLDGDGFKAAQVGGNDCNDASTAVKPKAAEIAGNGIDDNCDGIVDSGSRNCTDNNPYTTDRYKSAKGYCTHAVIATADLDADGWVASQVGGPDCRDDTSAVHPGTEGPVADGGDTDCDGLIDDGEAPIGVVSTVPGTPADCPSNGTCQQVVVTCNGVPMDRAFIAIAAPTAAPRGVIVLFSGSRGDEYWGNLPDGNAFIADLNAAGFEVDRVNWPDVWTDTLPTGPYGLDTAGCRAATATSYLYQTRYLPLGLSHTPTVCGFCIGGNSGGATQAAYTLADYGLETIVDAEMISSGPTLAALAEACLAAPGDEQYAIDVANAGLVDLAYGFTRVETGPCVQHDPSYASVWQEDSLSQGGSDYVYPNTRVYSITGGLDTTTAPAHIQAYIAALTNAGSPLVTAVTFPNAGHGIISVLQDPDARQGLYDAFTFNG